MPRTAARTRLSRPHFILCLLTALLVAAPLLLAACGEDEPAGPSGAPSITGPVKSATPVPGGAAVASFLIDQGSGDYDKAQVSVGDETDWYRRSGDKVEPIEVPSATSLVGKRVEVQFAGAVAESYPVQASAGWVIVLE
jgi:hypothetical protein